MQNTVLVERKLRQNLMYALVILFIFCALMIAMLVCFSMIGKQNLNGNVTNVDGTIAKAERDDSINVVTLTQENGEKQYNIVWDENKYNVDWTRYIDKKVTLVTATQTFGASNTWALGLKVDNVVIVDYNDTITVKRAENKEMITIAAIIAGILGIATCGVFIWRVNINPTVERPLAEQYAEFLTHRQPTCPARKKMLIGLVVWLIVWIIFMILFICFTPAEDNAPLGTLATVFLTLFLTVTVGGLVAFPVIARVVFRQEIDFYENKLPFDFTDISFAPMAKKVKTQLQKEIKEERERYPHIHGDGGNGYDVEFTYVGVNLYEMFNFNSHTQANNVSDVFPDMPKESTPFYGETPGNVPVLSFTYDELKFEAVAHYRSNDHPMMIIIKSRLARRDDMPDAFANDLHFAFDINLLKTIETFNIPVENLQFLLENKKTLMLENCYKKTARKKQKFS